MIQFIITIACVIAAIIGMGLALYFSKYKKRKSCACGSSIENTDQIKCCSHQEE